MHRIFPKKNQNPKILLYLNPDFKQSIQVQDQDVAKFLEMNNHQQIKDYNILLIIKNKKDDSIVLKRKLNKYQRFSQVLSQVDADYKAYLVLGYDQMKNQLTKPQNAADSKLQPQPTKYIRSGILFKYSQKKQLFQECQFKLHPDYLMYHKIKKKDKFLLIPLETASIDIVDQSKHIFSIVEKFKTIKLKSLSKQDMKGWLLSISQTIRIKYEQRYVNNLSQRVSKHQNQKIKKYHQQCKMLLQQQRLLLSDAKGRAALKQYFKKNNEKQNLNDIKILNLLNKYHYYCELLRQQAEQAKQVLKALKGDLKQLNQYLKSNININLDKVLESNQNKFNTDVYKVFQSISYFMGTKYHNILLNQRYLHNIILQYAVTIYKQNNKIHLMSILNKVERNKP